MYRSHIGSDYIGNMSIMKAKYTTVWILYWRTGRGVQGTGQRGIPKVLCPRWRLYLPRAFYVYSNLEFPSPCPSGNYWRSIPRPSSLPRSQRMGLKVLTPIVVTNSCPEPIQGPHHISLHLCELKCSRQGHSNHLGNPRVLGALF